MSLRLGLRFYRSNSNILFCSLLHVHFSTIKHLLLSSVLRSNWKNYHRFLLETFRPLNHSGLHWHPRPCKILFCLIYLHFIFFPNNFPFTLLFRFPAYNHVPRLSAWNVSEPCLPLIFLKILTWKIYSLHDPLHAWFNQKTVESSLTFWFLSLYV